MLEITGFPNVPASKRNNCDSEVVGFTISSSGGKIFHYWIQLDNPRGQFLKH